MTLAWLFWLGMGVLVSFGILFLILNAVDIIVGSLRWFLDRFDDDYDND